MSEFYVGYQDPAPPGLGRLMRIVVTLALVSAVGAALLAALGQRRLPAATFEYGTVRSVTGFVVEDPYPSLLVDHGSGSVSSRYLLVGPGKRGAGDLIEGASGTWVTLDGTLVFRDGQTMLEVVPGSLRTVEDGGPAPPRGAIEDLGVQYVEGEIVGAKCYLGVMNPGSGTVHRACATHCIRGGVPPMMAVRFEDGRTEGFVLVDGSGAPLSHSILDRVASPVGIMGRLVRVGPTTFLHADPLDIRRLP